MAEVVPSLNDEDIKDAQKWDPALCRFMEIFHEYTEKPSSKLLASESPDVKIFFFFFCKINFIAEK